MPASLKGSLHGKQAFARAMFIAGLAIALLPLQTLQTNAADKRSYHIMNVKLYAYNQMILGLVHGHQAARPDGIVQWWRNQSHGNQPVKDADILIHGHFHHLTVKESGRRNDHSRWIIQCPTLDAGSSWYRLGMGGDDRPNT